MKRNKRFLALSLATVMGLSMISVPAETVKAEEVSQEYVVMAKNDTGYEQVEAVYGDEMTEESVESEVLEDNNIAVLELTEAEAEKLEDEKNILIVEEDIILEGSALKKKKEKKQNTELEEAIRRKEQQKKEKKKRYEEMEAAEEAALEAEPEYEWNLKAIGAEEAAAEADELAEKTEEGEISAEENQKIKVAVLDSGVDYVSGINLTGYVNYVDEAEEFSPIFQDMTGHGTGIAGIIAGNGETGIYGVNPNAELYSVKIIDENNMAPLSRVIRGIYWCIENDIDIVNMSFGTPVYSQALEQAVKDAYEAGLLLVAAAGNGSGAVEYPAAFPEVMAVAATNTEAEISEFSNTGEELDVAAPGEKIRVASYFDGSVVTHGTSVAVPHVSGVASLLWEKDPEKSNEFIRQLINYSAKEIEGTDDCGLLDAEYALSMYETFAENYDETVMEQEMGIPVNEGEAEKFEEINIDETYVEGRWAGNDHQAAVSKYSSGFSTAEINLLKYACVYPDKEKSGWKGSKENPCWHGKWRKEKRHLTNYVTVCEMISSSALDYGKVMSYNMFEPYGLDKDTYDLLKKDIENIDFKKVFKTIKAENSKANRKYFLYGCAIHTITDAFAHSAAEPINGKYVRISHESGADDKIKIYPKRYDIASRVTGYALTNLKDDVVTDAEEVIRAVNKVLNGEVPKFRIIDLKRNVEANGYEADSMVRKLNVDSNKTDMGNGNLAN